MAFVIVVPGRSIYLPAYLLPAFGLRLVITTVLITWLSATGLRPVVSPVAGLATEWHEGIVRFLTWSFEPDFLSKIHRKIGLRTISYCSKLAKSNNSKKINRTKFQLIFETFRLSPNFDSENFFRVSKS